MKKIFLFSVMLLVSMSAFSQLYVNEDGNVGVNYEDPIDATMGVINTRNSAGLEIWGNGAEDIAIYSKQDTVNGGGDKCALKIYSYQHDQASVNGIEVKPYGSTNRTNCAINGQGGSATWQSIGVCGNLGSNNGTYAGAGVVGSANSYIWVGTMYSSKWAGYFNGNVRVNGTIYADLFTPATTSNGGGASGLSSMSVRVVSTDADAAD